MAGERGRRRRRWVLVVGLAVTGSLGAGLAGAHRPTVTRRVLVERGSERWWVAVHLRLTGRTRAAVLGWTGPAAALQARALDGLRFGAGARVLRLAEPRVRLRRSAEAIEVLVLGTLPAEPPPWIGRVRRPVLEGPGSARRGLGPVTEVVGVGGRAVPLPPGGRVDAGDLLLLDDAKRGSTLPASRPVRSVGP